MRMSVVSWKLLDLRWSSSLRIAFLFVAILAAACNSYFCVQRCWRQRSRNNSSSSSSDFIFIFFFSPHFVHIVLCMHFEIRLFPFKFFFISLTFRSFVSLVGLRVCDSRKKKTNLLVHSVIHRSDRVCWSLAKVFRWPRGSHRCFCIAKMKLSQLNAYSHTQTHTHSIHILMRNCMHD